MAINIHVFEITGLSSLLMHNPAGMTGGSVAPGLKKKTIPTPEDEAEQSAYRLPDGQLYLPSMQFRGALLNGGKGKRIGKLGATSQLAAGVFCAEIECPLYHPRTGKPLHDYTINRMRAVVMGRGIIRCRAEIREWATKLALELDYEFIVPDQALDALNFGGRLAGVGDYRPEKKGPYGRFEARLVDVKAEPKRKPTRARKARKAA